MNVPNVPNKFDGALSSWLAKAQEIVSQHTRENFPNLPIPTLEIAGGKKFIKISKTDGAGRSVYAFVEVATGDVLKAASWAAPAKGARGNIYTDKLGVGPYGADYLR